MNNNQIFYYREKLEMQQMKNAPNDRIAYQIDTAEKELPCLSMQNYTFTKNAVRKMKREIHKNLKNANHLIHTELRTASE